MSAELYATRAYVAICALVVGLACAAGLAVYAHNQANSLRSNQVAACERGNRVRSESNDRAVFHELDRRAFILVWTATRAARLAEWRETGNRFALRVARAAGRAVAIERSFHFERQPLVDCEEAIPKP